MPKSVYVSSTFIDLQEHRAAVSSVLRKLRYAPIAMEDYVARDARVSDECLRDVAACDIYLGIFAWRYGYVPQDSNPNAYSITELEYRKAVELKKSRLLFVLDGAAPWGDEFRDSKTGESEGGARIRHLRELVGGDGMPGRFGSVQDVAVNTVASVHLHAVDARIRALSSDLASASCLTMNSSSQPEIIENVRRAITENEKTDVIKVNLGSGTSWWSTRLYLLAALCADYTSVRQILLEGEGYRFVGMCEPLHVRRALSRSFPKVEAAYRDSIPQPEKVSFNPVDDVKAIVETFSTRMDALGGEPNVKEWVAPHLPAAWPGASRSSLEVPDSGVTPAFLEGVLNRDEPFIVLVRGGIVQKIVDRAALATKMALTEP